MPDLSGATLAIVGAGVLGLSVGVQALQCGAKVTVYSAEPTAASASGVAAGMLAPAFEAALDPLSGGHFPLLKSARDAWPAFIASLGLAESALDRSGALRVCAAGDTDALGELEARLTAMGAAWERLDATALRRGRPELSSVMTAALFTPEDWRIDPIALLDALEAGLRRNGGRRQAARVGIDGSGRFVANGQAIGADAIIVAAGPGALAWRDDIPELGALEPIKGQILTFDAEPRGGPVVRGPKGYLAPQRNGAMAGATMEVGRTDAGADLATVQRLRADAVELCPHLASAAYEARAGVRASTCDGLPLVGPTQRSGVHLAVGARRNGWLLAPVVAQALLDGLAGRTSPYRRALHAGRYLT